MTLFTTLIGHSNTVNDLVLINSGSLLASSNVDTTVRIWDLTTYTTKFTLNGLTDSIMGIKQISSDILDLLMPILNCGI